MFAAMTKFHHVCQRDDNNQDKNISNMPTVSSSPTYSSTTLYCATKKISAWRLLGGGLLCALFSLNAVADTGICTNQTYSVPIPMPALIAPGGLGIPAVNGVRVPISFTCAGLKLSGGMLINPNTYPGQWTLSEWIPGGYNVPPNGATLWYRLRFENVTMNCTRDSSTPKTWRHVFPSVTAQTMALGREDLIGVLLDSRILIPEQCRGTGTQRLSADAVFDFSFASNFPAQGPLSGLIASLRFPVGLPDTLGNNLVVDFVLGGGIVTNKTCQMSTSGNVQMGNVSAKDIEAGSAPLSALPATINITDCPANVNVALTASDVVNPMATGNMLTLTNASDPSVAKGVGISFYYNGGATPVNLNQVQRVITNTVEGAQAPITLTARYVKNGQGAVTAGRADAQATITLNYN